MWVLAQIYLPLCGSILIGILIGILLGLPQVQHLSNRPLQHQVPAYLGKFLFWIGVPGSLIHFLRQVDLSGRVLISPLMAWVAFAASLFLAWCCLQLLFRTWTATTRGTFLISTMVGNTGYIGYPVVLLLPQLGTPYFGWAIFYDLLGTLFAAYGLGVIIGAHYSRSNALTKSISPWQQSLVAFFKAPTLPAFLMGLALRPVPLPNWLDSGLQGFAWSMVTLSLILMGIRLQQLRSWGQILPAIASTIIRMAIAPLLVGLLLTVFGITGAPRLVIVLQAGMPSAFATLVLAETFNLDRELSVTCIGVSSVMLLLTLPLWLWSFPV
ncbi:AEC family transporter [Oscillatoria sp. CS-180]|uniref:AEC family transporter n=1 Tax=Oscillatoria sp. CS-180 TaxID=3021720 RepID=UPI003FA6DB1D